MWSLKILTGDMAGNIFKLENGANQIGRAPTSHVVLSSQGISKAHANIQVNGNAIAIQDLGSSNGTFINGLKVERSILQVGDKVGFHNLICELQFVISQFQGNQNYSNPESQGNLAEDLHQEHFESVEPAYAQNQEEAVEQTLTPVPKNLGESFNNYIENVLLPGVYKLAKLFELKMVIFSFVLAFIFITTALSTIPMLNITKDTIERESGRRALGVARSLNRVNQEILSKGFASQLTTRFAEKEEGVEVALIINADTGAVIAPANQAGAYKNVEFIHRARKIDEEYFDKVNSKIMGASVPMRIFDPSTGSFGVKAYAMVLYNMGSLAIDEGRTVSLFVQTLLMALILGSILYFFLYKLIERPFRVLNDGVDLALTGNAEILEPEFQFPILNSLYANINSLINQSQSDSAPGGDDEYAYSDPMEKQAEAKNLCSMVANPAFALSGDGRFMAVNTPAEEFLAETEAALLHQDLESLYDASLKLSLQDLLDRSSRNNQLIQSNHLEFGGINMEIDAQAIMSKGNLDYIFFSINTPQGEY